MWDALRSAPKKKMSMQIQAKRRAITRLNKVKTGFEWVVDKDIIGAAKEEEATLSPQYNVKLHGETTTWAIELYPKGKSGRKKVSLFLSPVKVANATKTKVRFNISLMKAVLYQKSK